MTFKKTSILVVLGLAAAEIAAVATMMPASAQETSGAAITAADPTAKPVHFRGRDGRGEGRGHERGEGRGHERGEMRRGGQHGDQRGGMRGGPGGGQMLRQLLETYDTDGDGSLTQDELIAARTAQLTKFDTDGDGSLTIDEYEALWLDAMRERMVDRFQAHDDDGTGTITVEEFNENFTKLVERGDRNGDGVLNADDMRMGRQGRAQSGPAETPPAE